MRVLIFVLALTLSWSAGAADDAETGQDLSPQAVKKEMEQLASKAMTETVRVIGESGGFYPYAMLLRPDGKAHVVAYSGSREDKPPAQRFAHTLYWQIADLLTRDKSFRAAVLVRPHIMETKESGDIPGVWALVDHRLAQPWVMFLPLLEQEDGTRTPGEIMYLPSTDPLFLGPDAEIPPTVESGSSSR